MDVVKWVMLIFVSYQGETRTQVAKGFETEALCNAAAARPVRHVPGAEVVTWCVPKRQ